MLCLAQWNRIQKNWIKMLPTILWAKIWKQVSMDPETSWQKKVLTASRWTSKLRLLSPHHRMRTPHQQVRSIILALKDPPLLQKIIILSSMTKAIMVFSIKTWLLITWWWKTYKEWTRCWQWTDSQHPEGRGTTARISTNSSRSSSSRLWCHSILHFFTRTSRVPPIKQVSRSSRTSQIPRPTRVSPSHKLALDRFRKPIRNNSLVLGKAPSRL